MKEVRISQESGNARDIGGTFDKTLSSEENFKKNITKFICLGNVLHVKDTGLGMCQLLVTFVLHCSLGMWS
jgi:hypothetical protein